MSVGVSVPTSPASSVFLPTISGKKCRRTEFDTNRDLDTWFAKKIVFRINLCVMGGAPDNQMGQSDWSSAV